DGAAPCIEPHRTDVALGHGDLPVLDVHAFLNPPPLAPPGLLGSRHRRRHAIHRHQPHLPEQDLVMCASEGGVVDDPWAPGTSGWRRLKQPMATFASPPLSGTHSMSRIIRPR